MNTKKTQKASV